MEIAKKSVLCISSCCGSGHIQAARLIHALNAQGLVYNLNTGKHKSCVAIFDRFGIDWKEAKTKRIPYIYIDDLLFPAEKLNDPSFLQHLIDDLKKTNPDWKEKIVKKEI